MKAEQIIKGLEAHTSDGRDECNDCPYDIPGERCIVNVMKDALALIKELQAHNETLKKENKYLRERLAEEMEHKEDMKGE